MELATLVAKIMGLIFLSAGIGAMNPKLNYEKVFDDFAGSPGLRYLAGFMALILGMIIVQYHNLWVKDWPVIVTIFGWLGVIKGVMLIAFPDTMMWFKPIFKKTQIFGFLAILLGLLFGYFGFLA